MQLRCKAEIRQLFQPANLRQFHGRYLEIMLEALRPLWSQRQAFEHRSWHSGAQYSSGFLDSRPTAISSAIRTETLQVNMH